MLKLGSAQLGSAKSRLGSITTNFRRKSLVETIVIFTSFYENLFFAVEGWPENKSRIATDYVNYEEQTAILEPNQVFSSPDTSM